MTGERGVAGAVLVVAFLMVTSVLAMPVISDSVSPFADGEAADSSDAEAIDADAGDLTATPASFAQDDTDETVEIDGVDETDDTDDGADADDGDDADAGDDIDIDADDDAVEDGIDEGVELAQSQGVEVSQEQRDAALEAASESAAQHQDAESEQVQEAAKGAVHGSLMQEQRVEVEQIQAAVGGSTDGALAQHQTVEASQMQAATWGATHGALAQEQRVAVEQIQVATYGGAAGAAAEAGEKEIDEKPKIQEAAQGASYGVLEQHQQLTAEQRQQVTLEHVQHAAAGASAGALDGSTETALEQDQRIDVEQEQRVDIKQVQKAATGGAKGALVQQQEVSVEQTQSAAHGASAGALKQVQTVSVEQVQRVSSTQIQEASFGGAKGSISQSQEATVEQVQAAADGAAGGVLVQQQEVSISQLQYAAVGAAEGSIEGAIQEQVVEVEQIQAAAFGAGEGAVVQHQVVDVTQVQKLATGSASGVLAQHQEATVEQLQIAASSACQETAKVVQYQQISITQLQVLTQDAASDATAYAIAEGIDDGVVLAQYVEIELEQRIEVIDELEGEASITFADQEREDGERVVVDSVDLSEGGFVAIYAGDSVADPDAVLGVSESLESGEHADVEIDLEEPLEDDQTLVAVAHHDTTDDGSFEYAASDGVEDEPYVTPNGAPVLDTALVTVEDVDDPDPEAVLEVSDQTGDGETLVVDEASADTDFAVTAEYDGEQVESERFEANDTQTDLELALEPPIENDTSVDVAVVDDEGEELATDSIEYELADDPPDPEATLEVSDQTGEGDSLVVDEASADVPFVLTVSDDGEQLGQSEAFEANDSVGPESIDLEPPLEEDATLEVALEAADGADDDEVAADADLETDTDTETADDEANDTETDDEATDDGVLASETIEYTVDDDTEPFEATFVDCTQAEVTGSFEDGDTIIVATSFYESSGIGNTLGEYAITVGEDTEEPLEGTITYETGDEFTVEETADGATVTVPEGDFGAAITGFSSPDAVPGEINHPNPDAGECVEEVRPELPDLTVENTDPNDDTIAVTFGYENPNDAELIVGSEFLEGTTDDEPPSELEPGTETFTVEWTPEDDDERLVWGVDMSIYDYDEDAVEPAATDPAGEIAPDDPEEAEFDVEIVDTNDPVEPGEPLEIDAAIENVGDDAGEQEIELALEDEPVDATDLELESEEGEEVTLSAETDDLEAGEYAATVSSDDDADETTVTVEEPGEAEFGVEIVDTNDPVEPGEPLEVTAAVENVGDAEDTQTIELALEGDLVDETDLSLEPEDGEEVTLTAETDGLEAGEYTATVASEDDTEATTVVVDEPGEAEFAVSSLEAPETGEPGDTIDVSATIENVGDDAGSQTVTYSVDGDTIDEQQLELEEGGSETVAFQSTLPEGESTHAVATEDDEVSVTIEAIDDTDEEVPAEGEEPDEGLPDEVPEDEVGPPEEVPPDGVPGEEPDDDGPPDDVPDDDGPPDDVPIDDGPPEDVPPVDPPAEPESPDTADEPAPTESLG
ncbi:DUF7282 domain-containing protein [Natronorubrum daqingense]|uniref:CARDB protein n=1 Tax=Natronorubrum daqingense TaxID=588898 RepID=A0A1N7C957_9EURY|nr:CARDB domain-containing protein [Natronorubrum daqingense]APX96800.1 hypothetical protein BB347_09300 [Natronorubrum daqingense]SIR60149.1 CARDB protein [Natronorubrum daqingense]